MLFENQLLQIGLKSEFRQNLGMCPNYIMKTPLGNYGEKIFPSHIPDKGLGSRIHRVLQLNSSKTGSLVKDGQRARHFSKEDTQTSQSTGEDASITVSRETRVKTTVGHKLTPVRVATTT